MGKVYSTLRRRKAPPPPRLPVELLVLIEEFVVGDNCFRTAANLNIACRFVHQETLPVLYAVALWRYGHFLDLTRSQTNRMMQSKYRQYVKFLFLLNVADSKDTSCDTFDYTEAFPNIKIVFYEDERPSSLLSPFTGGAYRHEGISCANGTSLVVFKPTCCMTLCDLIQSIPTSPLPNIKAQVRRRLQSEESPPPEDHTRISRLRFRFDGVLLVDALEPSASKLEKILDHRSIVVDLGDEPLQQSTSATLELLLNISNLKRRDGTRATDLICHGSEVPSFMTALAGSELDVRESRHLMLLRPAFPGDFPMIPLLDQWVHQYLVARRRFYDTCRTGMTERLLAVWNLNESVDWQPTGSVRRTMDLLSNGNIQPMVQIRVAKTYALNFLIWNADMRLPDGKIQVNALGVISGRYPFQKLYSVDS